MKDDPINSQPLNYLISAGDSLQENVNEDAGDFFNDMNSSSNEAYDDKQPKKNDTASKSKEPKKADEKKADVKTKPGNDY